MKPFNSSFQHTPPKNEDFIKINPTKWAKCPRCWKHDPTCGENTKYKNLAWKDLCFRCADVLEDMFKSDELLKRAPEIHSFRLLF